MASHRKPKQRSLAGTTARTAATLAVAGVASVTALSETGHAEPNMTPRDIRAKVEVLYREAEQATEAYNSAEVEADAARADVERLQDELARKADRANATRDRLGSIATAQYRSGGIDPAMQLALDSTPGQYLDRAGFMNQISSRQSAELHTLAAEQREVQQIHDAADAKLAALRAAQRRLADRKAAIESELHEAQALVDRLNAEERAALSNADGTGTGTGTSAPGSGAARAGHPTQPSTSDVSAPSARAARAVAFSYNALGLPYIWGATGPDGYDCSGLVQAAWRSAGVALPRTTYTQINAGERIAKDQLQPGDLVFFYSGISHVGIYIGSGQMIHAPHPGAPVRISSIDEMPFAGATRPS